MKVKELVKELMKYPEMLEVGIYHKNSEGQGLISDIKLNKKENSPYCKGDSIWDINKIDSNIEILFLNGC